VVEAGKPTLVALVLLSFLLMDYLSVVLNLLMAGDLVYAVTLVVVENDVLRRWHIVDALMLPGVAHGAGRKADLGLRGLAPHHATQVALLGAVAVTAAEDWVVRQQGVDLLLGILSVVVDRAAGHLLVVVALQGFVVDAVTGHGVG